MTDDVGENEEEEEEEEEDERSKALLDRPQNWTVTKIPKSTRTWKVLVQYNWKYAYSVSTWEITWISGLLRRLSEMIVLLKAFNKIR